MKKGEIFLNVLVIATIAYGAYWAYINGLIFEGDHWDLQIGCEESHCNRALHPTYLNLVLFSGAVVALALNVLHESISFKFPFSKIKTNLQQQIDEIKALGPIHLELCCRTYLMVLCSLIFGLLLINWLLYENCHQFVMKGWGLEYPRSDCSGVRGARFGTWKFYDRVYDLLNLPKGAIAYFITFRIGSFIFLWYFVTAITQFYNFLRFGVTTVTHSDDGNK